MDASFESLDFHSFVQNSDQPELPNHASQYAFVQTMTAATARKKDVLDPSERSAASGPRHTGLWVDESLLPTTLAKKGLPAQKTEENQDIRLLTLADILLNLSEDTEFVERRKNKREFKGEERRLMR
jgi:hypothetical protein